MELVVPYGTTLKVSYGDEIKNETKQKDRNY